MSLHVIQGLMGGGKTFSAIHHILKDYLLSTERPIYTNLPVNWDQFLISITDRPALREQFMGRIQNPLHCEVKPVQTDAEGAPKEACVLREFWWHSKPNSVVIIDECADIWNARDFRSNPETLQSYINHHRHYKDDIYFLAQSSRDLDAQIRRKIQTLWVVYDSTTTAIASHPFFKGIRWPLKFFIIRVYLNPGDMADGKTMVLEGRDAEDTFYLWPSKRRYACYRSFSQSASLPGKLVAGDDAKSGNTGDSRENNAGLMRALARMAALVGAIIAAYCVITAAYAELQAASKVAVPAPDLGAVESKKKAEKEAAQKTEADKTIAPDEPDEIFLLATPGRVETSLAVYRPGDRINGRLIGSIDVDGIHWEDGQVTECRMVFRRRAKPSFGDRQGDQPQLANQRSPGGNTLGQAGNRQAAGGLGGNGNQRPGLPSVGAGKP